MILPQVSPNTLLNPVRLLEPVLLQFTHSLPKPSSPMLLSAKGENTAKHSRGDVHASEPCCISHRDQKAKGTAQHAFHTASYTGFCVKLPASRQQHQVVNVGYQGLILESVLKIRHWKYVIHKYTLCLIPVNSVQRPQSLISPCTCVPNTS